MLTTTQGIFRTLQSFVHMSVSFQPLCAIPLPLSPNIDNSVIWTAFPRGLIVYFLLAEYASID